MIYKDITVGIVAFKSEKVIFNCLKKLNKINNIIVFDNSNDLKLRNLVVKKYPKIKYILSKKNLGFGAATNKIFKHTKTNFYLSISPDTIVDEKCINVLIRNAKSIKNNFSIMSPLSRGKNYGYFEDFDKSNKKKLNQNLLEVDYVTGCSMLINLKKLKKIGKFDENIFLYLEEIDLCRRFKLINEKIYICNNAKAKQHLSAQSSDIGFEYNKCQNWHWMWSSIYYNIKHHGFFFTINKYLFKFITSFIKSLILFLFFQHKKSLIYVLRTSGMFNAFFGNKSWYRPSIN
ncbi:glycosyltransferase [Candidatus Pelagibacter sp.]|nr:glycosyltransferase [Candidatus Pelagibacter sp.]